MNTFEKHGINYLSASTINLWIMQPALCLLKISGITDQGAGPSAWRGNAVDRIAAQIAADKTIKASALIKVAHEEFDRQTKKAVDVHDEKKITKERNNIEKMVIHTHDFYRSINDEFKEEQGKVKIKIGDIPVPWIGYFDLLYADKVRDVKTVARKMSGVSSAHARQASIYAVGTGREPWIDYISTTGVAPFEVKNVKQRIAEVENAALALQRTLSFSDDIFECCRCVFPDLDHWIWGETTKLAAKDIWQIGD